MHSKNVAVGRNLEQNQLIQRSSPANFHGSPSQYSYSIGDTARESYRLSTFKNFQGNFSVEIFQVAAHGFFYTNVRNVIQCFSCSATAELSIVTDETELRRIHKRNCKFANGNDSRNKSIQEHSPYESENSSTLTNGSSGMQGNRQADSAERVSIQTSEHNRSLLTNGFSQGQDYAPSFRENFSIQAPETFDHSSLTNGFSRLQHDDSFSGTAASHTSGGSSLHSNFHSRNLVTAPTLTQNHDTNSVIRAQSVERALSNDESNFIINNNYVLNFDNDFIDDLPRQQQRTQSRNVQLDLASLFPCNYPINPFMGSADARLQSFYEHIETWSNSSQLRASIDDLVEAGLFCLGERDRTKCWYCNGGLQNWRNDDDPWEEHAKWFPMCEFVLQKKGPEYVHRIVARFPNVQRPQMLNQVAHSSQQNHNLVLIPPSSRFSSGGTITSGLDSPYSSETEEAGPVIVDPEAERRKREQKIENALRSSGVVTQARIMGFQESLIKLALKKQFELHDENFTNMDDFIDAILSASNNSPNREASPAALSVQPNSLSQSSRMTSSSSLSAQSALQEINNLTESRTCRKCRNNPACMVFIPCGHIVCCYDCRNDWECCPVCHSFISEKIRSYLA